MYLYDVALSIDVYHVLLRSLRHSNFFSAFYNYLDGWIWLTVFLSQIVRTFSRFALNEILKQLGRYVDYFRVIVYSPIGDAFQQALFTTASTSLFEETLHGNRWHHLEC